MEKETDNQIFHIGNDQVTTEEAMFMGELMDYGKYEAGNISRICRRRCQIFQSQSHSWIFIRFDWKNDRTYS